MEKAASVFVGEWSLNTVLFDKIGSREKDRKLKMPRRIAAIVVLLINSQITRNRYPFSATENI